MAIRRNRLLPRVVTALGIGLTLITAPVLAAEAARSPSREAPSYESPILSLLLLPVNLLIRMASVFEPEKPRERDHEAAEDRR